MIIWFLIVLLLTCCNQINSAETPGGVLLDTGLGARPIGMGEAFVAASGDINALYYNPAAFVDVKTKELSGTYLKGLVDTNFGTLGYALPVSDKFSLGMGLATLDGGNIEINYSDGRSEVRKAQQDYLLILSYASKTGIKNISAGISLKALQSELVQAAKARAVGVDLGFRYQYKEKSRLGLSVQNIGTEITYSGGIATGNAKDPMPLTLRAGIGGEIMSGEKYKIDGALDLVLPKEEKIEKVKIHSGIEYLYKSIFALRVGHRSGYSLYSFSFGLGFKIRDYQFDYGLAYMSDL
ncbi:MAG: PorV/PorQ family protein, partial [Elusimicrobiota bacterium]